MKKATWSAVGLLVLSLLFFFFVRSSPGEAPDEPYMIPIGEGLLRIEIKRSASEDGAEHIVLDRRRGRWWMTRPVQAPLADSIDREFGTYFGRDMGTDDVRIGKERAEELGLGEDVAVRLVLIDANKEGPEKELWVGDEILVAQTGARRTFVMDRDREVIYRAHGGFGELVRRPLSELRSRSVISVGDEGIRSISLRRGDGQHIEIEWKNNQWRHVERGLKLMIDQQQASRLANQVGRLRAIGFFGGAEEAAGLNTPAAILGVRTGEGELKVEVGEVEDGGKTRYFARHIDGETIYELSMEDGEILSWGLSDLRARAILAVGADDISKIRFIGDDERVFIRDGRGWSAQGAAMESKLDMAKVESLAQFIGGLRAKRWTSRKSSDEESELFEESIKIEVVVQGEPRVFEIGGPVGDQSSARYGRYSGQEGLFILGEKSWRRLTEDELVQMVAAAKDSPLGDPDEER